MGKFSPAARLASCCLAGYVLALGVLSTVAPAQSPPLAQGSGTDWAMKMFSETSHDFGVVASGAEVKTRIKITNPYEETVRISSVTPSCSCTSTGMPSDPELSTYESTEIELSMDTLRFRKHKDAVVTVRFSQPSYAEVKIPVQMYVRSDVVLQPGGANFGNVQEGQEGTQKIEIAYAGFPDRADWRIVEAKTSNPHLEVRLDEISRTGGGTSNVNVNYSLTVHLKPTAPAGAFRGMIDLVTNDSANPRIPVVAEARIEGEFSVTPGTLMLGTVRPGTPKTYNVVVRGRAPFVIEKIECDSASEAFAVPAFTDSPRPVHVVPMEFTPPAKAGVYQEVFSISIAGRPEPVTFKAIGRVLGSE